MDIYNLILRVRKQSKYNLQMFKYQNKNSW